MWAQTWSGIMDLVNPYPDATQVDVTQSMIDKVLKLLLFGPPSFQAKSTLEILLSLFY